MLLQEQKLSHMCIARRLLQKRALHKEWGPPQSLKCPVCLFVRANVLVASCRGGLFVFLCSLCVSFLGAIKGGCVMVTARGMLRTTFSPRNNLLFKRVILGQTLNPKP